MKTLPYGRVFVFSLAIFLPGPALPQQSIGDVYASDATVKGNLRYTSSGLEISNGSVITAGEHSATLRLARGGQVRICPGTNLTVNTSPQGQELMFAMSAGSLEGDYQLPATADACVAPHGSEEGRMRLRLGRRWVVGLAALAVTGAGTVAGILTVPSASA